MTQEWTLKIVTDGHYTDLVATLDDEGMTTDFNVVRVWPGGVEVNPEGDRVGDSLASTLATMVDAMMREYGLGAGE